MNALGRVFGVWLPMVGMAGQLLFAVDPSPQGSQIHIPIGVPDASDTLKTFVEPDGSFSPGFGSFGVSFRLPDGAQKPAVSEHGLRGGGALIPWCRIPGGGAITGTVEICAVKRPGFLADSHIVAARVRLENTTDQRADTTLSVNITPEGPAGV